MSIFNKIFNKKNMQKENNSGFTLVELIVVIMVLSILSTLGFVSYVNYAWDARDAKRTSDVWNLTKQLELRKIDWEELNSFVLNDSSEIIWDIEISGRVWNGELDTTYTAWDADFVYLELVWENFTDPSTWDPYKIWITNFQKRYEVAASIENNWEHKSFVDGTWLPRTSLETQVDISKIIWDTLYLSWTTKSDLLLYAWDLVTVWSISPDIYEITRVFHTKIKVDRSIVLTGATLQLNRDESEHIIKSWSWDYPISTNSWTLYTPYNLWE